MTRCSTGRATQKYKGSGTDLSDILETQGDIIYADSTLTAENLSISGTPGDVLKVSVSGVPEWGTSTSQWVTSGSDISYITGNVGIGTTTPDANLHVNGNAFVSSNLALGGVLSMGTVNVVARHTLSAITATGNLTPNTVIFDHPTTAFVTTANVGIGTTTPVYDLDVAGDINFTGALTQNGTTYGGGGSGSSQWVTSGSDIHYPTGDVGIGTTSPQGNLHISSGTSGDCRLILQADTDNNNEGDNPRIEFWQDGAIQESAIGMTSNRLNLWNSVGSGGIAFHTNSVDGWTNAIERMAIDTNGNVAVDTNTFFVDSVNNRVGIGTSSPTAKLQVVGDIQIPNGSSLTTSTTDTFTHDGGIMPHYGIKWRDHSTTVGAAGPVLQLSAYNGYKFFTQGTERVTVSSTGNVGIGTAAPVGVNGGQRLEGSSTTGFEFIAASSDTTNIAGQFMGAFLIKNMDATTTAPTPHYVGMAGREGGTTYSGHVDLLFYSGRDNYENNTPQMVIDRYSNVGIGTTTPGAELHVSGTGAIIVPSGPTVDRPGTLVTGMIRYNTTSLKYEGYGMGAWLDLSIADTITQLYTFTSHTFTKAGGDTRYGPYLADTITAYGNITPWNDTALFNVTTRGFQLWTVPKTGTYRIHAKGARGGLKSTSASPNYGNTPGYGGYVYADFALTMNTKIVIIVGQQPPTSTGNYRSGSGGGATWVLKPGAYTNTDDVYLVAGGGGGAGPGHYNSGQAGSADASSQGTLGGGGTSHWNNNGGGAGWTADGAPSGARGGVMPSGGAMGGTGTTHGGFGGGGSESGDSAAGGAGATGGRAAYAYNSTGTNTARGGTSYIQPDTLERISGTTYYKGSSYDNDGSVLVQYIP